LEKWGYQHIRKIGKGGFGHVVLVSKFFISMNFYAVKCFSLKNNNKEANLKRYI
jgi:serine/threonine protein kinase